MLIFPRCVGLGWGAGTDLIRDDRGWKAAPTNPAPETNASNDPFRSALPSGGC
jgi:hypothetical protein